MIGVAKIKIRQIQLQPQQMQLKAITKFKCTQIKMLKIRANAPETPNKMTVAVHALLATATVACPSPDRAQMPRTLEQKLKKRTSILPQGSIGLPRQEMISRLLR